MSQPSLSYVHGYERRETERLRDQASALADLLHHDTSYPAGSRVLEAGCGVGAQTVELLRRSPGIRLLSVDIDPRSLDAARASVAAADLAGVTFRQADLLHDELPGAPFDHVFVCFVLEHLPDPVGALRRLLGMLRPGGTLTAIEGDHGSVLMHPEDSDSLETVRCLVELQRRGGGDALIGRRLHPVLREAGAVDVLVSPRPVQADAGHPGWQESFTLDTFTAMVAGVRDATVASGLMSAAAFERGLAGLRRCAREDAAFCYTFYKATARRPA